MRTNIEGVETLKTRAAELKKLIEKWYLRPGSHQFEDVRQRTEALCAWVASAWLLPPSQLTLCRTLSKAAEDAQGIKARGIIKRFFTSNSDAKKLEGLVEDVNRAIQDFVVGAAATSPVFVVADSNLDGDYPGMIRAAPTRACN